MRDEMDLCLEAAFRDVAVPEGLAERVLAGLAAPASTPVSASTGILAAKVGSPTRQQTRRRWQWAASVLMAAVSLVFTVWLAYPTDASLSEESILSEAIHHFATVDEQAGRSYSSNLMSAPSPISRMITRTEAAKWANMNDFAGYPAIVYELSNTAESRAALYVIRARSAGLGAMPLRHPFTTGGCCASTWQEAGLIYVLVVQGDSATYARYLNLPRSPLA